MTTNDKTREALQWALETIEQNRERIGYAKGSLIDRTVRDWRKHLAASAPSQAGAAAVPEVLREALQKIATHAKIAADNIVEHAKAKHTMTGWLDDACTHADIASDSAKKLLAATPSPAPAAARAESKSRAMFVARLENMSANGDQWLTVPAVLALLNDCDMLAAREVEG